MKPKRHLDLQAAKLDELIRKRRSAAAEFLEHHEPDAPGFDEMNARAAATDTGISLHHTQEHSYNCCRADYFKARAQLAFFDKVAFTIPFNFSR